MRNRDFAFLVLTLLAAIGAAVLAAHGGWGVRGEWQWQHHDPRIIARMRWYMPTLPALALIAFSMWLLRRARRGGRISAAWALVFVALAFALQLSTLAMVPSSTVFAGAVIISPVATTYFEEAGKITDMRAFLADYPAHMRTFSQHAQTYPPGPIVLFWLMRQAVQRFALARDSTAVLVSAITGMSTPDLAGVYSLQFGRPVSDAEAIAAIFAAWRLGLLACVSIILVYLIARAAAGDAAAVCAAAVASALPAVILFTPSISQLIALESMLCIYLFHLGWSRGSPGWGAAAGAMWTVAALTSLAMFAIPLLLAAWVVAGHFIRGAEVRPTPRRRWPVIAAWVVGSLAVFALAYFALGINFPAIVKSALGAHRAVITHAFARTYSRWLGWNLFDFWMFLGAGLGLWLLRQMVVEAVAAARGRRASLTPLLWAVVVTLAALDVSGVTRAEVGRIWMFLMLPAAAAVGRFVADAAQPEMTLGLLLAAQLLQIAAFERHLALFVIL